MLNKSAKFTVQFNSVHQSPIHIASDLLFGLGYCNLATRALVQANLDPTTQTIQLLPEQRSGSERTAEVMMEATGARLLSGE